MPLKHMKSLIVLVLGLLAVGCLTPEQKQKILRDSVVGEYGFKHPNGTTIKLVFLENGVRKWYENGEKPVELKWTISNGELHVEGGDFAYIHVVIVNSKTEPTLLTFS